MRRLAMTGRTHRARETVGGSAACHGTAWRGQAKRSGDGSTHRALSGARQWARRSGARCCVAAHGSARPLTPHPFAGAAERRGLALLGWATHGMPRRGEANTQRLTGRCSLPCANGLGDAEP
jgi:hypothetical protein